MPRFLLAMFQPDGPPPPPEFLEPVMRGVAALNAEMKAAGVWVGAMGLTPAEEACVVRVRGGKSLVTDGPFSEAKEHMGGYTIIEVNDREAALQWAEKMATVVPLPIEVREVRSIPGGG